MIIRVMFFLILLSYLSFAQKLIYTDNLPAQTPLYWHATSGSGHYAVVDRELTIPGMRTILPQIHSGEYAVSVNLPNESNPAAARLFFRPFATRHSDNGAVPDQRLKPIFFNNPYTINDRFPVQPVSSPDLISDIVNSVNIDSIYLTEQVLTGITPYNSQLITTRYAYSSGVLTAQNYLADRLSAYGYDVALQPFTFLGKTSRNNIIATRTGNTYPDGYYIICAHYDDISPVAQSTAPGADDNGSGTSAVIEAARILSQYEFAYTIKFVLFCAEEQGLIGSAYYASQAHFNGDLVRGVLNMDMIGYDGNSDMSMEIHGGNSKNSQHIATVLNNYANQWTLPLNIEIKTTNSSSASDHSSFWNYDYGAVMIIEDFADFTPYYHTTQDLLSSLDPLFFRANAQLAIGGLAGFAGLIDPTAIDNPNEPLPLDFEVGAPFPNPFNPVVSVPVRLTRNSKLQVAVFSANGETVFSSTVSGNSRRFVWNGRGNDGTELSSGLYLIRFSSDLNSVAKKVLLIR